MPSGGAQKTKVSSFLIRTCITSGSAIGIAGLPFGNPVEVEIILEVVD